MFHWPAQSPLRLRMTHAFACCLGVVLTALAAAAEPSPHAHLEMLALRLGGRDIPLRLEDDDDPSPRAGSDQIHVRRYAAVSLPDQAGRLTLLFGAPPDATRFAPRLRYQLVGYDSGWRNHERGFMHLVLKYRDDKRIPVSRSEFRIRGDSVGWTGTWATSTLSSRIEEAVVPPRAAFLSIWIDSGGNDENTGVWLVDDLAISEIVPGAAPRLIFSEDFEVGRGLAQPEGDFARWVRDGGALDGAVVHAGPPAAGKHALALVESNPTDYAAWRLKDMHLIPVSPGQRLRVEWRETYSVGRGRAGEASYPALPAGQYQFRVQEVDALGRPAGQELLLPVFITPPFHQNVWFQAAAVTSLLLIGLGVERSIARVRMRRKLAELERRQVVQQERARIARDIHDDLGTVLSRISMTSETASLEAEPGSGLHRRLTEICEASRQLTLTMEEIVWAQDPRHDSLDNTASYFSSFASDLLSVARIACRLDIPADLPAIPLDAEKRHDLFRAFKEALNNVIKHSGATEVRIAMHWRDDAIALCVEDNGRGAAPGTSATPGKGNGLPNMRTRIERAGGRVEFASRPGEGTRVLIVLPVRRLSDPAS